MRRLTVFNQITLDGYFTGENGDLSWAHTRDDQDAEWQEFIAGNAKGGGTLVFGRVTYDLMAGYWPTPEAAKQDPVVAKQMNALPKIVFSRSLERADWNNTRVIHGDPAGEIRKLKQEPGKDLVIFGSGKIIAQLAPEGLIDEYQLVVKPVVLGKGRTMFDGVERQLELTRTSERSFKNGRVLLCYQPANAGQQTEPPAGRRRAEPARR
ncbi:MAG TPA: dihydrofolate reductase family protein [Gemmatimonadales bacterium]|nr:dihydrofolate reductase family protein [Gemmatimonadales bacterium]